MKEKKTKRGRYRYLLVEDEKKNKKCYKIDRKKLPELVVWCYRNNFTLINTQSTIKRFHELQPSPLHL